MKVDYTKNQREFSVSQKETAKETKHRKMKKFIRIFLYFTNITT